MDDLIRRQAALDIVFDFAEAPHNMYQKIRELPSGEIVRCKDCKHYKESVMFSPQKFCFRLRGKGGEVIGDNFAEDDFCSYGERSEECPKQENTTP